MNARTLSLFAVGLALGMQLACGSAKTCTAATCADGCCDDTGTCQPGTQPTACGAKGGFACTACALGQQCNAGLCATSSGGGTGGGTTGGGTGGGVTGGGGGATGGGTGGGTTGGGTGGGATGGGTGGGAAGGGGGTTVICGVLGDTCSCPDAGPSCTSAQLTDDPYLWCKHERCISFCNAPTQPERDAKCPAPFQCTNYAFGNESPTWQCR